MPVQPELGDVGKQLARSAQERAEHGDQAADASAADRHPVSVEHVFGGVRASGPCELDSYTFPANAVLTRPEIARIGCPAFRARLLEVFGPGGQRSLVNIEKHVVRSQKDIDETGPMGRTAGYTGLGLQQVDGEAPGGRVYGPPMDLDGKPIIGRRPENSDEDSEWGSWK